MPTHEEVHYFGDHKTSYQPTVAQDHGRLHPAAVAVHSYEPVAHVLPHEVMSAESQRELEESVLKDVDATKIAHEFMDLPRDLNKPEDFGMVGPHPAMFNPTHSYGPNHRHY